MTRNPHDNTIHTMADALGEPEQIVRAALTPGEPDRIADAYRTIDAEQIAEIRNWIQTSVAAHLDPDCETGDPFLPASSIDA